MLFWVTVALDEVMLSIVSTNIFLDAFCPTRSKVYRCQPV